VGLPSGACVYCVFCVGGPMLLVGHCNVQVRERAANRAAAVCSMSGGMMSVGGSQDLTGHTGGF